MKKRIFSLVLAFSVLVLGFGKVEAKDNTSNGTEDTKAAQSEKLNVYTSFYPIYDLTKQIAGDKVNVMAFMPLDQEPHEWEPSAKDVASLEKADLLIVNGAGMEERLDDAKEAVKIDVLDTTEKVDLIEGDHAHEDEEAEEHDHEDEDAEDHDHDHEEEHEHHHGKYDPHTWLSLSAGKLQAESIKNKLSELDPENKETYEANYEKLAKDFDATLKDYQEKFKSAKNKNFVVPHEAFAYFCRDFGLTQVPLTGIVDTEEPDLDTMNKVTKIAKDNKINTIFFERGGSDKAATTIANEIGGEAKPLATLEFISKDEVDKVHYQDLIKENLEAVYESVK